MTIQQCKYVLKIAECGSLNEAAKQLFVAQSSLSVSVKSLEQELNIKIFERAGNGISLTEDGAEFVRYAKQLAEQNDFIVNRYSRDKNRKRLYVSTQHYDFVADIFGNLVNQTKDEFFDYSLREMKTYDVIRETETAYCDIGIIAIKSSDIGIMQRYLKKKNLLFTPFLEASPHIFVRKNHPLADKSEISLETLGNYPFVSYEQGEHSVSFFAEEIVEIHSDKHIEISDRASLMNVLLSTDCYTVGTGIMPSLLNEGRIVSIPFESEDHYTIGYILRSDINTSKLTKTFIEMLNFSVKDYTNGKN
ncbi:MAG: LysR family transcriptional regulator [Clostridia bacterium]|nr:LysR family transcriptional regulator [Clostridia bacterium]